MARGTRAEAELALEKHARRLFLSKESIQWYTENATVGEIRSTGSFLLHELELRAVHKRERLFRKARFPMVKSVDGYDFSKVVFPEGYSKDDLLSLEFVSRAQDFVFHGQTGRGKTHLAIAIGAECVKAGKAVRFFTTAELVLALRKANDTGGLDHILRDIAKSDLVILDEFGYVPVDVESSRLLYQVVSACYEQRSLILTTNIEFSKWGTVLGDEKLAAAMIDRIVHHGRLVEFGGSSRRMEEALMMGRARE